jgi:glycerol-3-phosphate acyltransferase PlsY
LAFSLVLAVIVAYLLGSIPVGVLVCKPLGRDPRTVGSGRTGGTNVYRAAGMPAAVLTVAGDIGKGYLAVLLADRLVSGELNAWAQALAALAVIIGHNYSLFAGFKGGAGSTPNVGAVLRIDPAAFVLAFFTGATLLFGLKIASLASLTASAIILLAILWRVIAGTLPWPLLIYGVGQLVLVVWALRPNIARLRAGTERRLTIRWRTPRADGDAAQRAEPQSDV